MAVVPSDGRILAPCDATVSSIYDTGHAVCLTTETGGELLIHIGIDTVKMEGKGFTKKVSDGDQVKAGDVLVEAVYDTATMMILTNADDYDSAKKAGPGQVDASSVVMKIKKA